MNVHRYHRADSALLRDRRKVIMAFELKDMDFGSDITDVFEKEGCKIMRLA